jgi:GT2 family glycosyltransferase
VSGRLSIVIPSHNRPDLLRCCLASVLRHAPAGTEVIVVDDASPAAEASAVATAFTGVRVLRLVRRSGFCVAVNLGLRTATAEVVELLNDDTEVTPGWTDAVLPWFRNPRIAAVAPLVLQQGPAGQLRIDSAGDRYYLGGVAGKRGHGETLSASHLRPGRVFGASGSSAFYRRDAVLRAGALPESFGAYFEDVDLAFRLHWAGYEVAFEPSSRVWHHGSASHGPPRSRLLEQQSRNEERVFWRNVPGHELPRALPRHLATLAGKALRRWRDGTLLPFLRGRLSVLSEVPELCRHRRWLCKLGPAANVDAWGVERRYWG